MKKFINKINPLKTITSLKDAIHELIRYRRYVKIINELDNEGKLIERGIRLDKDSMYIGVNLNPDLLLYGNESQEAVELRFVSESMRKYTDFLEKEGILDAISADYERIYDKSDFYGYIVRVKFKMTKYSLKTFLYNIIYILTVAIAASVGIYAMINKFV